MVTMNLIKLRKIHYFTAYLELKDYNNALNVLNDIQQTEPNNPLLYLKKADFGIII